MCSRYEVLQRHPKSHRKVLTISACSSPVQSLLCQVHGCPVLHFELLQEAHSSTRRTAPEQVLCLFCGAGHHPAGKSAELQQWEAHRPSVGHFMGLSENLGWSFGSVVAGGHCTEWFINVLPPWALMEKQIAGSITRDHVSTPEHHRSPLLVCTFPIASSPPAVLLWTR